MRYVSHDDPNREAKLRHYAEISKRFWDDPHPLKACGIDLAPEDVTPETEHPNVEHIRAEDNRYGSGAYYKWIGLDKNEVPEDFDPGNRWDYGETRMQRRATIHERMKLTGGQAVVAGGAMLAAPFLFVGVMVVIGMLFSALFMPACQQ